LRHAILDSWRQRTSFLHDRDPRAKLVVLLGFLVLMAGSGPRAGWWNVADVFLLLSGILAAKLPVFRVLKQAAAVLPLAFCLALSSWLAGDPARAGAYVAKSYLSALAVLILLGTTPMPRLVRALQALRTPPFLLMVAQSIYRYLFVISEEAQRMRMAALSRGSGFALGLGWRIAARSVAVLFTRSYARAGRIHQAMLARGWTGNDSGAPFPPLGSRLSWSEGAFAAAALAAPLAARVALRAWA
jgi:cobalt/nickel transport system permease protein